MHELNDYFKNLDDRIRLIESRRKLITKAERTIKSRLLVYLKKSTRSSVRFCRQGSWALDTLIVSKKGYCDLDFGVRLYPSPDLSTKTMQSHIKKALIGLEDVSSITCKNKCVRVYYDGSFHIDITIYGLEGFAESPSLATKEDWEFSDPSGLKKWFEDKAGKKQGQLRKIVKYLKLWADLKAKKMPAGLCFTVLATENYVPASSDFLSLKYTTRNILDALEDEFICEMPVEPNDDLFENWTNTHRDYFLNSLASFSEDLNSVSSSKPSEAVRLLNRHFKK